MQHIETVTVGAGGAASITFSAIPDSFTDLLLVLNLRSSASASVVDGYLQFNNDTTAGNYSWRSLLGLGSSVQSANNSANFNQLGQVNAANKTANTFGNSSVYIPNYRSSVAKSHSIDYTNEGNETTTHMGIVAALWTGTSAITSMDIKPSSGSWVQYSSASLYGIRKYNTTLAPKASGGIISYDAVNNKWVHVFTASGTFTPTENLSGVEYLVVAGGGGGGFYYGAGGGAGGYRSSVVGESSGGGASAESTLSLTASTNYTVTVGAGGAGANSSTFRGSSGNDSVFGSITALGGGGGGGASPFVGSAATAPGLSGGSGGGAGGERGAQSGGAGTTGQGYAGEDTPGAYQGGGGGAGEAGGTDGGKQGGDGVSSSITGSAVIRAGGGGGGSSAGGEGGGGAGGVAGTAYTGGGGGGDNGGDGRPGGSGIVIVRYSA